MDDWDYQHLLPFQIGNEIIGNIGQILSQIDAECKFHRKVVLLNQEIPMFYRALGSTFNELRRNLPKHYPKRGNRYIFIVDRRNPQSHGNPHVFNGPKTWPDTLYILCPSGLHQKYSELPENCGLFPEASIELTMEFLLPLSRDDEHRMIGAKHVCNGYMFTTSYQLFQSDKIKTYFFSNGYGQRFTENEYQYYWPRLFMKEDGELQRCNASTREEHCRDFAQFFEDYDDEEHLKLKHYAMNFAEDVNGS